MILPGDTRNVCISGSSQGPARDNRNVSLERSRKTATGSDCCGCRRWTIRVCLTGPSQLRELRSDRRPRCRGPGSRRLLPIRVSLATPGPSSVSGPELLQPTRPRAAGPNPRSTEPPGPEFLPALFDAGSDRWAGVSRRKRCRFLSHRFPLSDRAPPALVNLLI